MYRLITRGLFLSLVKTRKLFSMLLADLVTFTWKQKRKQMPKVISCLKHIRLVSCFWAPAPNFMSSSGHTSLSAHLLSYSCSLQSTSHTRAFCPPPPTRWFGPLLDIYLASSAAPQQLKYLKRLLQENKKTFVCIQKCLNLRWVRMLLIVF